MGPAILKEISPECSLEEMMLKLKLKSLATSCEELTHWKRLRCWEVLGAGGKGDDRGWDGWMASPTQWTWVWVNSGVGDGQGGLACCDSWGCKDLDTTEQLNWTELNGARCHNLSLYIYIYIFSFKSALSLSSLTLMKRLFSSSSLSAFRVVSSTYLRLLMFLFPILIRV